MGLLDSIREVLGLASATAKEPPAPTQVTIRVERVTRETRADPFERLYLPQEQHAELLQLGSDGLPPLRLVRRDTALWLAENTTGKLINVDNRYLRRLGIWGVKVRGTRFYDGKAKLGPAELVREPDNPHDSNAVAVHVDGQMIGHYNKGMASSLAKRLDSGEPLEAIIISTEPAKVIAARSEVLKHLRRDL